MIPLGYRRNRRNEISDSRIAKDRQLFVPKRLKKLLEQNSERFEMLKGIECGSLRVKVDMFDQEKKIS